MASSSREYFDYLQFSLHPNPVSSSGQLNLQLTLPKASRLQFRLLDITGRPVRSFDLGEQASGGQSFSIDMAGLADGVYFLETSLSRKVLDVRKVMVK
ncbi:MAG: T9SS type A sorting domain-containing protein [Saprospirales bacterium]|nr:T9SS type A sorting domain-containing protein [Saprospirales bacterium]